MQHRPQEGNKVRHCSEEKIKEPGVKGLKEVLAARDAVTKERDEIDQTVKAAFQELVDGKLAEGDPRKNLVAGLKNARSRAESPLGAPLSALAGSFGKLGTGLGEMLKTGFDDAALVGEVNYLRLRDSFIPTTEQQIDRLAAALKNRDEKDAGLLADAAKLGAFAAGPDAKSSDRLKGKAQHLLGLAERNQGKFDAAKKSLESATALAGDSKELWAMAARRALAEMVDPSLGNLANVRKHRVDGNHAAALAELDAALAANPGNTALLAERSLVALEKTGGRFDPKAHEAIRADATAALNDAKSAAVAGFVLGRLEETNGNVGKAEEFYRKALTAIADDETKSRLQLALGRLLLRDRTGGAAAPVIEAPKADEKKEAAVGEVGMTHPLSNLIALLAIQQVPSDEEDDPAVLARIKESLEIAEELLKSKDKKIKAQGHFLKGDAISRQGRRTEGLKEYAKGLELLNPEARLGKLLDEHPAFQTSEGLQHSNPILAEKHYGVGLHLYQERKYGEAETQFQQAIRFFDKDARYHYYLGLCQLEQGGNRKQDAAAKSLEQGGRLEANARPSTVEVNAALERIQGDRRAVINAYRQKSLVRD